MWWQVADGTDTAERLTTSPHTHTLAASRQMARNSSFRKPPRQRGGICCGCVSMDPRQTTSLVQTPFDERNGMVYRMVTGWRTNQIAPVFQRSTSARTLETGGGQWQVSTAGGTRPVWARTGRELFFFSADGALEQVTVEATAATWNASSPTKLFEPRYFTGRGANRSRTYDISPDGRRFLMIRGASPDLGRSSLIVVQHWDEELKRLAPK